MVSGSCILTLAPGGCIGPWGIWINLRQINFKVILIINGWGISSKIALRWMSLDLTDDKSTRVQVMAWCREAASHYLSQCWPGYLSSFGITRPQWVNDLGICRHNIDVVCPEYPLLGITKVNADIHQEPWWPWPSPTRSLLLLVLLL